MELSGISNVYIAGAAAISCFVIAIIMMLLMAGQIDRSDEGRPVSFFKSLFGGESLTQKGMNYRIIVFIALMFTIMNILATVFIFIAEQTQI